HPHAHVLLLLEAGRRGRRTSRTWCGLIEALPPEIARECDRGPPGPPTLPARAVDSADGRARPWRPQGGPFLGLASPFAILADHQRAGRAEDWRPLSRSAAPAPAPLLAVPNPSPTEIGHPASTLRSQSVP